MTIESGISIGDATRAPTIVRQITATDLINALKQGLSDFNAKPTHVIFLCVIYPIVALVLARLSSGYDLLPLFFPLLSGFALIGPLAATGIYELSRRREQGLDYSWWHVFDVLRSPSLPALALLGLVLMAIFIAWLVTAMLIYRQFFGDWMPESATAFLREVLFTEAGWGLIIIGCGAGFFFAVLVLAISVVSLPMLLDRHVGAALAVKTSINAVLANPWAMALWGLIVAGALVLGSLPFFVGLAVVLPVLGHATWHLYRKVVIR
ncbi:MAG: DUF2189 domain-containing protein [Pseudomonadota bacterium]